MAESCCGGIGILGLFVQEGGNPQTPLRQAFFSFPDVLLVFTDGHVSRFFLTMIERMAFTNVTLFKFPSHLSQDVQPLDVSFFKQLKRSIKSSVLL